MPLALPRWLLKAKDPELFDREYRKQLELLDAKQVAEELGPNAILLCWESFNVRCHRRLVAEWLDPSCLFFATTTSQESFLPTPS